MSPDFCIISNELELKLITLNECDEFAARIAHSSTLHQWLDWATPSFTPHDAHDFLSHTRLNWIRAFSYGFGIYRRHDNHLVGMIVMSELSSTFRMANIGYWIFDHYQQQGFAKKALTMITEFAFDKLALTRVEIICDPENRASQCVAKSCGAEFECTAKNRFIFDGVPRSGAVYSITL